jgi:dipeptidyl aminopeptidase/acylaminoacyl peptidase
MIRFGRLIALIILLALPTLSVVAGSVESAPVRQYLSIGWARALDFSPRSIEVLFTANITGVPQIWTVHVTGGWPHQVTFDPNGASFAAWSPVDNDQLLVATDRDDDERDELYLVDRRGGPWQRLTKNNNAIYRYGGWTRDGRKIAYASNERDPSVFDIHVLDVMTRETEIVFKGDGRWEASGWSPDGRYLALLKYNSNADNDLFLYDTLTTELTHLTAHEGSAMSSAPEWLPDSRTFYFTSNLGREFAGLAKMNLDSGRLEWVETPDWDVERAVVSRNGRYLAWIVNVDGYSEFNLRDMATGDVVRHYRLPKGVVGALRFSPDSQWLLITHGSATDLWDIYAYLMERDKLTTITHSGNGGISPDTFVEPELVRYPSFDGREIPALFFKPTVSQEKMPAIVYVHGGPATQARPDFSPVIQYFLSRGYAVFVPNVRGSSGYGKTYAGLDDAHKRADAVADVEHGARWLASRRDVDSDRLIVVGHSYGGFMVLSCMAMYPERWAAGVDMAAFSNLVSFIENSPPWRRACREAEYGILESGREFLEEISPMSHVDKIRAPLLIIHGANDPVVPKSQADELYEAVEAGGIPVEYIVLEDEGHTIDRLANRVSAYTRMVEFLDKHVQKK